MKLHSSAHAAPVCHPTAWMKSMFGVLCIVALTFGQSTVFEAVASTPGSVADQFKAAVLASGPVAYWQFDNPAILGQATVGEGLLISDPTGGSAPTASATGVLPGGSAVYLATPASADVSSGSGSFSVELVSDDYAGIFSWTDRIKPFAKYLRYGVSVQVSATVRAGYVMLFEWILSGRWVRWLRRMPSCVV
jgi:hypothetical protein